jgi:hypothetical protein
VRIEIVHALPLEGMPGVVVKALLHVVPGVVVVEPRLGEDEHLHVVHEVLQAHRGLAVHKMLPGVNPVSMKARKFSRIASRPFQTATPRLHVRLVAPHHVSCHLIPVKRIAIKALDGTMNGCAYTAFGDDSGILPYAKRTCFRHQS